MSKPTKGPSMTESYPTPPTGTESWRAEAACRRLDVAVFFPASRDDAGPAQAVCATCPVAGPCDEYATSLRLSGVWAGKFRAGVGDAPPRRMGETRTRWCETCGTAFTEMVKRGAPARYCSDECRPFTRSASDRAAFERALAAAIEMAS